MTITYNKQYSEQKFDYFVLYKNSLFGLTNVFWEYYNIIKSCSLLQKEEIIDKIQTHKKESKSSLSVIYTGRGIEFFKPNKSIFPEFYILWSDKKQIK